MICISFDPETPSFGRFCTITSFHSLAHIIFGVVSPGDEIAQACSHQILVIWQIPPGIAILVRESCGFAALDTFIISPAECDKKSRLDVGIPLPSTFSRHPPLLSQKYPPKMKSHFDSHLLSPPGSIKRGETHGKPQ